MNRPTRLLVAACLVASALAGGAWAGQVVLNAPWGADEGAVGLLNQPEMERCGPLSFTVGDDGVWLLDTVNQRLSKAKQGGPLATVAGKVSGWSICPDGADGCFVIYDGQVSHYGAKGVSKAAFGLPSKARLIEGYGCELSLSGGGVVYSNVEQKTYQVASGNAAEGFQAAVQGKASAQVGLSGRAPENLRFHIKRLNALDVRLLGEDADGKILVTVPVQMDGDPAGATLFKGQDDEGRVYVELERLVGGRANLEVHRYSTSGERLAVYPLLNDYFTTVYKKTEIAPDGFVYQMLTTPEGTQVIRY